ncbi:MAG: ABC transporter substrate-binding protein [Solirubrobacteraceae bacterium]|nr:ABC transporter substrate-binding protein [Solirubrobacteraceae bacterium]
MFPRPMRSRASLLAVAVLATATTLSACGSGDDAKTDSASAAAAKTEAGSSATGTRTTYPLTIKDNCGVDVVVEQAPKRVVSVNQGSTEILLSLGLEDRMVGTSTWTDAIRPNLAAANAKVPRLGDNDVSYERVLKEEPDLVTASFGYALSGDDPDRRTAYAKLGVPTYLAPSHCDGRTDESGDGPRDHPLEMETIYEEIRQLAEIFDVQPRGEALVAELEGRLAKVSAGTKAPEVSVAFWFANTESPYMAGANGSPGIMAKATGAKNAFDDTTVEWPQVSWETVLDRDPTVLVLGDLRRKSQTGDKLEDKIRFLKSNPVTKRLTAVREERFVIMNGADMNPSIRTVDGAEKLAAGIAKLELGS